MRLAAAAERIHGAGAEVIAISIDDEVRQAGMFERWPTPHVQYIADPGGERFLGPLGLIDPNDERGIALPAMLVIAPDGSEVYRYQGRDFADRTTDDDVYAALDALELPAVDAPVGGPVAEVPDDLRRFFAAKNFGPYFMGNKFGALAILGRVSDPEAKAMAKEHQQMADASLEAWSSLQ